MEQSSGELAAPAAVQQQPQPSVLPQLQPQMQQQQPQVQQQQQIPSDPKAGLSPRRAAEDSKVLKLKGL
jgi:hypothetical protein